MSIFGTSGTGFLPMSGQAGRPAGKADDNAGIATGGYEHIRAEFSKLIGQKRSGIAAGDGGSANSLQSTTAWRTMLGYSNPLSLPAGDPTNDLPDVGGPGGTGTGDGGGVTNGLPDAGDGLFSGAVTNWKDALAGNPTPPVMNDLPDVGETLSGEVTNARPRADLPADDAV